MTLRPLALAALLAVGAAAHAGEAQAGETATPLPAPAGLPFPIDVGGDYLLTDHSGQPRSQIDPEGRMQLVFFGYANCQQICSVALPLMGEVAEALDAQGLPVTPLMITVDPQNDTLQNMGPALRAHHPEFVGLTGTEAQLEHAYDLFSVERKLIFEDPEFGPIYAHGSHIYLMDAKGDFLTLLPPILAPERVTEIVTSYAD